MYFTLTEVPADRLVLLDDQAGHCLCICIRHTRSWAELAELLLLASSIHSAVGLPTAGKCKVSVAF